MDLEGPQFWNTRLVLAFVPWTKMNDANLSLPKALCVWDLHVPKKNAIGSLRLLSSSIHVMLTFHDIPMIFP